MGDPKQLWFDVEEGYNTTIIEIIGFRHLLWFDVEEGYNTTCTVFRHQTRRLWFDVEEGYNTTVPCLGIRRDGCGLM